MKVSKRKLLTLLLVAPAIIVASCSPGGSNETSNNTLVVGSPAITGNFIGGFGSSAYDVWVRNLINGYSTYATTPEGQVVLNETVVEDLVVTPSSRTVGTGVDAKTVTDKTYTFTLDDELVWNDEDNTPITAKDFVFGILFSASQEWKLAGATTSTGDGLLGYSTYNAGDSSDPKKSTGLRFSGVRLIDETKFAVTLNGEKLPYFYETLYASFGPLPMHRLANPESTILSDNTGSTLSANALPALTGAGSINGQGGYRYVPDVTAGAYSFVSFVNQVVTLKRNPTFKGDYRGHTPSIENIVIKRINTALDVDLAISGEIDLTTGVIEAAKIDKAKASNAVNEIYYSRNGYGYLSMTADFGPTQDPKVRQAVAQLVDRANVTQIVLGGYGSQVFSEYGLAQWMYKESVDWFDEKLVSGELNAYAYDIAAANTKLNTTEWRFESNGTTPFDPTKAAAQNTGADANTWTYLRHNAQGEVLQLNHMGSENNIVTTSLKTALPLAFRAAGIKYTVVEVPFSTLLDHFYEGWNTQVVPERTYHMFNLATNFSIAYDPYYSWHSDWVNTDYNPIGLEDDEIDRLTLEMRALEPTETEEFLTLWREYQLRWNFLSPSVPLYSNQYFDITNSRVSGLLTTPFWDWTSSIVDMSLTR